MSGSPNPSVAFAHHLSHIFSHLFLDSAGSVQLYALGALLRLRGFTMWDMGMGMAYKTSLGGEDVPRAQFVEKLRQVRDTECVLAAEVAAAGEQRRGEDVPAGVLNARDIIDAYSDTLKK